MTPQVNQASSVPQKEEKLRHVYPFDKLKFNNETNEGESFDVGLYSQKEMSRMSGYVFYFNNSRKHLGRHYVQRKVAAEKNMVINLRIANTIDPIEVKVKKGEFIIRIFRDK
jgi:hypothetical protein